jgi:hypothetical protein
LAYVSPTERAFVHARCWVKMEPHKVEGKDDAEPSYPGAAETMTKEVRESVGAV